MRSPVSVKALCVHNLRERLGGERVNPTVVPMGRVDPHVKYGLV
jgi:hypothetical protein